MSVALMTSAAPAAGNTPSSGLTIVGDTLTLNFTLVTSGGPSTVTYFLEFSEDNSVWFQEVAEEDAGAGVVSMPKVLRTFADNAGTTLADGTHRVSCQFKRRAQFARVQAAVSAGACTMSISAPYGTLAA